MKDKPSLAWRTEKVCKARPARSGKEQQVVPPAASNNRKVRLIPFFLYLPLIKQATCLSWLSGKPLCVGNIYAHTFEIINNLILNSLAELRN